MIVPMALMRMQETDLPWFSNGKSYFFVKAALIATRSPGFMRWTWSANLVSYPFCQIPSVMKCSLRSSSPQSAPTNQNLRCGLSNRSSPESSGGASGSSSSLAVCAEAGVDVAKQGNGGILIEMGFSAFGRQDPASPDTAIDESGLAQVEARPANLVFVFGLSALCGLLELPRSDARQFSRRRP